MSPSKPRGSGPLPKMKVVPKQTRIQALNDNVRTKNLQITELNRQLKAMAENHAKQQKVLQKKNRNLEKTLQQMEKLVKNTNKAAKVEPGTTDRATEDPKAGTDEPPAIGAAPANKEAKKKTVL